MRLPTILLFSNPQGFYLTKTDYFQELFDTLIAEKSIEDYRIAFVEKTCKNKKLIEAHYLMYPNVNDIEILETDILWLRGHQCILQSLINKGQNHWRVAYRAGSGSVLKNAAHIEFDDFIEAPVIKQEILYLPFRKPVSKVFQYESRVLKYDFCLGANRVYDIKGQYKSYLKVLEYDKLTGQQSFVVCCGDLSKKELGTQLLMQHRGKYFELLGQIDREKIAEVFYQSKVFISETRQGQNDRCVTEALQCGCPVLLHKNSLRFFPVYIINNPYIVQYDEDINVFQDAVKKALTFNREEISNYSRNISNIKHTVSQWKILCEFSQKWKPSIFNLKRLQQVVECL